MGAKRLTHPWPLVYALVLPREGVRMTKTGQMQVYATHPEAVRAAEQLGAGHEVMPMELRGQGGG